MCRNVCGKKKKYLNLLNQALTLPRRDRKEGQKQGQKDGAANAESFDMGSQNFFGWVKSPPFFDKQCNDAYFDYHARAEMGVPGGECRGGARAKRRFSGALK